MTTPTGNPFERDARRVKAQRIAQTMVDHLGPDRARRIVNARRRHLVEVVGEIEPYASPETVDAVGAAIVAIVDERTSDSDPFAGLS